MLLKALKMIHISRFCIALEKLVRMTVLLGAIIFPVLIFVCVYEVVARYLFNASQIWTFDMTFVLYGALMLLHYSVSLQ
jgi:TRAP-type mannitol/chloroaromatic compound transport system permease small subunit